MSLTASLKFPLAAQAVRPGGQVCAACQRAGEHGLARRFAREPELILACLEAAEGSPGQALAILRTAEEALREQPQYADLYYYAAHAAVAAGTPEQALAWLGRALQLNPRYSAAWILAARLRLGGGAAGAAIGALRKALAEGADYADVHALLGEACRRQGEARESRAALVRARQLSPAATASGGGVRTARDGNFWKGERSEV